MRSNTLSFTFVSCIRQLVVQETDNRINVLNAQNVCRRSAAQVGVLEQSCCSASIERVLVYIRREQI